MTDTSFLPEDYLAQRAERRSNAISLALFVVVMAGVFGAFLVTNRQWTQIKAAQRSINAQYQEAALKIEELNELESQRTKMLNKAELAVALVERVPRSILLAELINRMPPKLSLTEFELKSTLQKSIAPPPSQATGRLNASGGDPARAPTREEAMEERKVEPPRYLVEIAMVGLAPTDLEVSRYMAELIDHKLLRDVTLKYSVQTLVDEAQMQEFRVEMILNPDGDVRAMEPLIVPRNPMSDEMHFAPPAGGPMTSADSEPEGGR